MARQPDASGRTSPGTSATMHRTPLRRLRHPGGLREHSRHRPGRARRGNPRIQRDAAAGLGGASRASATVGDCLRLSETFSNYFITARRLVLSGHVSSDQASAVGCRPSGRLGEHRCHPRGRGGRHPAQDHSWRTGLDGELQDVRPSGQPAVGGPSWRSGRRTRPGSSRTRAAGRGAHPSASIHSRIRGRRWRTARSGHSPT
jgi:hypothetical protein